MKIERLDTIKDFHRVRGLNPPEHPLISLVDYSKVIHTPEKSKISWLQGYYSIALKRDIQGKYRYGQQSYDFDEGLMSFFAPNQILNVEYVEQDKKKKPSGWILLIHPDFLWNTKLAGTINHYDFFNYDLTEALFLSEKEEQTILQIFMTIRQEYQANIDRFSQTIIVSQLELLLNYADRFYARQFITRQKSNHVLLTKLDALLTEHFNGEEGAAVGLPTVQEIAGRLNASPNYLSGLLKNLTGQTTQQHIHNKLIEKAKEKLSTTDLTVGEIAFQLGFEHAQSFNKLFRSKTNLTPRMFRESFRS